LGHLEGKSVLKNLSPYKPGKHPDQIKKVFNVKKIVKLASNENPYGSSPAVKQIFEDRSDNSYALYPDGHASELREALSDQLGVSGDQLVFGNGSDELIQMISRAYLYPGSHTIMATPTFPQYKHHALIEGAHIEEVPLNNGAHDLKEMFNKIHEQTKVIWLCSPNNPTGTPLCKQSFHQFMEQCPKDILVVLDEAYYEYQHSKYDLNVIQKLHTYDNLITLRTFSKAYGLASLRIGYAVANKHVAQQLNIVRGPFNTSTIAQKAAVTALKDENFVRESIKKNEQVKNQFMLFLDDLGWTYDHSETNFLFVKTPVSGYDIEKFLLKHGFIIRPGEALGMKNTMRVTIGTEEEMKELQQLLLTFNKKINEGKIR